jgi:hypothetical protein
MPYTTVVAGTTITASYGNANIRDQVVTPFASASARTSAITSPVEGMLSYRADEKVFEGYNATSWLPVGWIPIASTTLGVAASSVSFTSVPATYRNLVIVALAKSAAATSFEDILLRFNNDSSGNYANVNVTADNAGGAVGLLTGSSQTSAPILRMPSSSLNATIFGGGFAFVLGYSSSATSNKNIFSLSGNGDWGNVGQFRLRGCSWGAGGGSFTATAVTRIDLISGNGNFVAASTFQLYGFGA